MSTPDDASSETPRVSFVRAEDLLDEPVPTRRAPGGGIGAGRRAAGLSLAAAGLPVLTLLLDRTRDALSLEGQVLLYLLAVVLVATVGGVVAAIPAALAAALLINYYFIEPLHTLDIAQGDQAVALGVFVVVAAVVSGAVELATRRARAAEQAAAEAETLAELAGPELHEFETLRGVLERARRTFNMETVVLKARVRGTDEWVEVDRAGRSVRADEAPLRFDLPTGDLRLIGRGPALFAEDQRVLKAFAAAAQTAFEARRLTSRAKEAKTLATVDRQRTALLAAVGHDLRTPLASIKAAVSSLRQTDVEFSEDDRARLLSTIEEYADRLDAIVANLLDASRLQAGAVSVQPTPTSAEEVVGAAILAVPGAAERVQLDLPDDLPLAAADPGLLERVFVNLIDNAVRHAGDSGPIEISAFAGADSIKMDVVDHGPGVPPGSEERLFEPFLSGGDQGAGGTGLGLSVARGFMEAMNGQLVADRGTTGGMIMRLRLPKSRAGPPPTAEHGPQDQIASPE